VKIESLVLLEGTVTPEGPEKDRMSAALAMMTWSKKDTWVNRKAALAELGQSPGMKKWHPRTIELFVVREEGLVPAGLTI
jgi:hypothetical protein